MPEQLADVCIRLNPLQARQLRLAVLEWAGSRHVWRMERLQMGDKTAERPGPSDVAAETLQSLVWDATDSLMQQDRDGA